AGVKFQFSTQATRLLASSGWVKAVETIGPDGGYGQVEGEVFVAALGSFTPDLVRRLGVACPVYPAQGHSASYPIGDSSRAPTIGLSDNARKIAISRLGNTLRVAGTAELAGYSRALNPARCEVLTELVEHLFPGAVDTSRVSYWSGLRPATPSHVPLIGRT